MGFTDVMSLGKTALDIANELKNTELKESILELREEILTLREENLELKSKLNKKENYNMIIGDNCYWNLKDDGTKEGPYCTVCWDKERVAIRLTQDVELKHYHKCGSCKHEVYIKNYKKEEC